jgi:hypothetical protein
MDDEVCYFLVGFEGMMYQGLKAMAAPPLDLLR